MVGDTWIPDASDPCLTCTCVIIPEDPTGMKGVTECDRSACSEEPGRHTVPRREKTGLRGFRPGLTQTNLYSHRSRLEALWIKEEEKFYRENKGYREADLRLCFRIGKYPVFSRCGSFLACRLWQREVVQKVDNGIWEFKRLLFIGISLFHGG